MTALYIAMCIIAALFALALYMTAPRLRRAGSKRFEGRLIAHRGVYDRHNAYPCENTLRRRL
jgi:hypothetical protein